MRRTHTTTHRRLRAGRAGIETLETRVLFAAGDLETTFGSNGFARADFGDGRAFVNNLASGPLRVVAVGTVANDSGSNAGVVAAFTHAGAQDTTFSFDGEHVLDSGLRPYAVLIQPDEKVLVAAAVYNPDGSVSSLSLWRFNDDGSADQAFGNDGRVTGLRAGGVSLAPDGKIVLSGTTFNPTRQFLIQRLNPDGSTDTTFGGGDGIATGDFNTGGEDDATWEGGGDTAVQPDGKIVLVGTVYGAREDSFWDGAVVRLNPDGSFDNTFSNNGRMVLDFGSVDDFAEDVAIDSDGTIVVAAIQGEAAALPVRVTPDGSTFTRFSPAFVYESPTIADLWIDSRRRVVLSGTEDDPFVGRYLPNGTFEPGFGGTAPGQFIWPTYGSQSAIAPDDGIYVGVTEFVANDGVLRVAKLRNAGGEDAAGTVILSNGTLTVTGTSRGDDILVNPGATAGAVNVSINGYARSFTGVSRVAVSAHEGDDKVTVAETFNLPTTLSGGAANDTLWGGAGDDQIDAGDGDDYLLARGGNDALLAGNGLDSLNGGTGNDRLFGGGDSDGLDGGEGADFISGGAGADRLKLPRPHRRAPHHLRRRPRQRRPGRRERQRPGRRRTHRGRHRQRLHRRH